MGSHSITIGILTSSRADFGIYLPLLRSMKNDNFFTVKLIVFGTHLSRFHGYTVNEIEMEGFSADYRLDTQLAGDTPEAIASSMALCMMKFSQFWGTYYHQFDLVFCLGDRYEMFAAVSAGAPFGIRFAHLHGGEQTLGAIDNFFRHAISHQAWCHFVSTEVYAERLKRMLDVPERIYNVGALSLDAIGSIVLLTREELTKKFDIHFDKPLVLVTFHPETVAFEHNQHYAQEIARVIQALAHLNFVVSLPNADTSGTLIRSIFLEQLSLLKHVKLIDSLGFLGYFSLMKHGQLLFGNSSSGIIEAASFGKYVINIGDRQKGRLQSANVINVPVHQEAIQNATKEALQRASFTGENIYYKGGAAENILSYLKQMQII